MEEETKKTPKIWIAIGIVVILALVLIFGRGIGASYFYNKGVTALSKEDFGEAKSELGRSLTFDSKRPETHYALARVALGRMDESRGYYFPDAKTDEAITHYEHALLYGIEKNPELHAYTLNDLGYFNRLRKEYVKSDEYYKEYISRFPSKAFAPRYFLALDYFERFNKPNEALEILKPAKDVPATDFTKRFMYVVNILLARLYNYNGEYEKAEDFAKLAIQSYPNGLKYEEDIQVPYTLLAVLSGRKGNFKDVDKYIRNAEELIGQPSDSFICFKAYAYSLGGEFKKAIAMGENLGTSGSERPYLYAYCALAVGKSYMQLDKKTNAKEYFKKFIEITNQIDPNSAVIIRERETVAKLLENL